MRIFWFIILGILVLGIIAWLATGNFTYEFALITKPEAVEGAKWRSFILVIVSFIPVVALLTFYLYSTVLYKLLRIDHYENVFKLGNPWVWGVIIALIIEILIGLICGLISIPEKKLLLIVTIIGFSGLGALFAILLYWIFTLFYSPPKVKYAPPFRWEIVGVFSRKLKGR
jgi:hypothetical protein